MKTWIQKALASATAMGVGAVMLGTLATPAKAEDAPIMTYGVDVVTDYVSRGTDQFIKSWDFHEKDHGPLNITPAIQPYFTLFGPSGFSLGIWTSFAITDRSPDSEKNFGGHSKIDELDYTFAYDWSNKLGGFTAAVIAYNYMYDSKDGAITQPEYLLKWVMPYAKSVNPYLAYYASPANGQQYMETGISGGEKITWAGTAGAVSGGLKHVTVKIGYPMGDYAVAFSAAYRPNAALVGYPLTDTDGDGEVDKGKYLNFENAAKDYPPIIAWLTLSYSGSVAAK